MTLIRSNLFALVSFTALAIACVVSYNKPVVSKVDAKDCGTDICELPQTTVNATQYVISQENWQFSLSGNDWITTNSSDSPIKTISKNETQKCSVVFIKEPTTNTYSQYVLVSIRALAAQYNHVNEVDQVVINGNKFVEVIITDNKTIIWSWISVKSGSGYGFICGGDTDVDAGNSVHDLCQEIANSIEIK